MLSKVSQTQTDTTRVLSYEEHGCYITTQHTSTHTMKMGEGTFGMKKNRSGERQEWVKEKAAVKVNVILEGVIIRYVVWTNIK